MAVEKGGTVAKNGFESASHAVCSLPLRYRHRMTTHLETNWVGGRRDGRVARVVSRGNHHTLELSTRGTRSNS